MKITLILRKNNRVQIFIDEEYSFSCTENFVIENRLYKDLELSSEELDILKSSAQYSIVELKMFEYATRGLYSKKELKQKTTKYCQKRFSFIPNDEFFEKVIKKLERLRIYNSKVSIKYLTQKYIAQSKGKRFIFSKLLSKGFEKEEIEEELESIKTGNIEDKLQKLLEKKLKTLLKSHKGNDFALQQKLYKFGISRGYAYGEIKDVVDSLKPFTLG